MKKIEVQDIFSRHLEGYAQSSTLGPDQWKAAHAILNCRTAALGGHVDECDNCGYISVSYNSCRNRNCPKCQTAAKEQWLDKQQQNFLNIPYFHVVFTLPAELNALCLRNPTEMYGLLFKAASETIMELCADEKYLGAKPGITAVLHTWGQSLQLHPHVHMIVTGGGLTELGQWRESSKKFFLPVKVLSAKFRGKFLALLQGLKIEADKEILNICYQKNWNVYCKPPFKNVSQVYNYLGRYTHRVAISNNRIKSMDEGKVSFEWRDYKDGDKTKIMELDGEEFVRRFLLHILPSGFCKIRHYGLFASRDKGKRLALCRRLTNTPSPKKPESLAELLTRICDRDVSVCPCCGLGHMMRASPVPADLKKFKILKPA